MNHNINKIDSLLEAYWQAETTLADEAALREYFQSGQVAEQHKAYTGLFAHFTDQRMLTTDLDVEQVLASISAPTKRSLLSIFSVRKYTMGIAAALTLMLSVVTVMNTQMETSSNRLVLDEAAETEEAMRVTKQALALLSNKINTSSQKVNNGFAKVKSASIIK